MPHQNYVVGFMFSECKGMVALIRKNRPEWQKGKLNGIGGKVERREGIKVAQAREFWEETGVRTNPNDWRWFLQIQGQKNHGNVGTYNVECFTASGSLNRLIDKTDEKIEIHSVLSLPPINQMVPNLPWLIRMALCEPVIACEYTITNNPNYRRTK